MRKFLWPLQRVLDLKCRQEELFRRQLVSLSEQAAGVRGRIMAAKADLRLRCSQIKNAPSETRLGRQEMFLRFVHVIDNKIRALQANLQEIERQRSETLAKVLHIRKERKALQKLRQKALEKFTYEQNQIEQKTLDEHAGIAFVRNSITPAVAGGM